MSYTYHWNHVTPEGVYIDEQALRTNAALLTLINNLKDYNMEILATSNEGVVIDYIDDRASDRIREINRHLDTFREQISNLDVGLMNQDTRIEVLEGKYRISTDPIIEIPPEKDESGEALYLMWDLLPVELKKKLIIYIKKL